MTKKQNLMIYRIILSLILFAGALVFRALLPSLPLYIYIFAFLPAYLIVGADVLWEAATHIFRGRVFDETFLMTVATVGAFLIGE